MTPVADPATPAMPRRPWLLIRGALILLGLLVVLFAVDDWVVRLPGDVAVVVSAGVAGAVSFGAMRRPGLFCVAILYYLVFGSKVSDSFNHFLFGVCLVLSWPLGAITGWAIRGADRRRDRRPAGVVPDQGGAPAG